MDMTAQPKWAEELRQTLTGIEVATHSLAELEHWVWQEVVGQDVLPRQVPEPARTLLAVLTQQLQEVRDAANAAFSRYSSRPVEQLFRRQPLSREEYCLLLAMGATQHELPPPPPDF